MASVYANFQHQSERDWTLTTVKGGYKTGGGYVKFYPCEKGGGGQKLFNNIEGGHKKFSGTFYTVA